LLEDFISSAKKGVNSRFLIKDEVSTALGTLRLCCGWRKAHVGNEEFVLFDGRREDREQVEAQLQQLFTQ